ncbi:MAG: dTDP-4-dehydrorhamnose reductase [Spirochaetales bacterium]|nr:dTDP-4-dehydrorhamnose reductase [Spirochaetales bacterium]
MTERIWLIGNRGMLGAELSGLFEREGVDFVGTDRDVDILDPAALSAFADAKGISGIVNCAAYTAVDRAEDEDALCRALNVTGPGNIAAAARDLGAWLIHFSTDYVFDGWGARPYLESDPVAPTGVYGRTKAEGERAAMDACPETIVLRTAWLYGTHGPNFVSTMLALMKERPSIGVVADQRGSPTWAYDLARAVLAIARSPGKRYGIYHYTNSGETTWHGFATEIHRLGRDCGLLDHDCDVRPLRTDEYPTKARRPAYSVLSKEKIKADYAVEIPEWNRSLERYIRGNPAKAP